MNYRHAFHAGNFADVVKHALLVRIVEYLKRKEKAFRVIDTHAGVGLYDLHGDQAQRTGEWESGIGRVLTEKLNVESRNLLNPLLDAVHAVNQEDGLRFYPGSPSIIRHLLRKQDRLTAIELHPQDSALLKQNFAGDFQVRVIALDGWLALGGHVPPKEKRGLVVIDPPFEKDGEFARIVSGLQKATRRWPGGIYAIWYPIKDQEAVAAFRKALAETGIPDMLDFRFTVRAPSTQSGLFGSGMIVINSPYVLEAEFTTLASALHPLLSDNNNGAFEVERLTAER